MDRQRWRRSSGGLIVLALLVVLVSTAAGCGGPVDAGGGPLELGEADNGKIYTVKAGDTIQVVLPGNPTTGYEWTADLNEEAGEILEQGDEPAYMRDPTEGNVVGVGGRFILTFEAKAAGEATLRLVYSRSFEDVEPLETFEAHIIVE
ncbi:MAG: protease inhibitor I42 family protein [Actinobacteria bacterium]|nr:protease inhibitor I42 family protein [Actinomycetota bacterium]